MSQHEDGWAVQHADLRDGIDTAARARRGRPARVPSLLAVSVVVLLVVLAGCAAPTGSPAAALLPQPAFPPPPGPTTLGVRELPGLGRVLTTGAGFVVYVFPPDQQHVVSCVDACAGSWPPVTVAPGTGPALGPGVDPAMVGRIPNLADPPGPPVVTYAGWPLYTYAADINPRQANGQGLDLNGGPWYVIAPSGRVVVPPDQLVEMNMT